MASLFRPKSMRHRVVLFVMGLFSFASITVGVSGYFSANHEVEEIFDARLAQHARLLSILTAEDVTHPHIDPTYLHDNPIIQDDGFYDDIGHEYESKIYFQVRVDDRVIVATDASQLLPDSQWQPGFDYAELDGYEWRTFYLERASSSYPINVLVAERTDIRQELITQIVWQSLLPELIGWPFVALFVWWGIGLGLAPLIQLRNSITNIEPNALTPLDEKGLGTELELVQQAINRLLSRLEDIMEREKRWIADAAHELRTPLTVLKLHAQNAQNAQSPEQLRQSLAALDHGVDRSTRMVAQLLAYARIENNPNHASISPIDILKVTRSSIAELLPLAWDRQVDIELLNDEDHMVGYFQAADLEMVLQNLLSNAVKFSPIKTVIQVEWQQTEIEITLTVSDQGFGVSNEDKKRLTERFYRQGEGQGAGLGLAIVRSIVTIYGGQLTFTDNQPMGLCVSVAIPTASNQ